MSSAPSGCVNMEWPYR